LQGQTPDECALYVAGPVVASSGNQVATVDSLQNYELTFTMALASDWSITGEWQSIFQIGDTHGQRYPGIWFHESQNALHLEQSHSYCTACCCGWQMYASSGVTFVPGETYDVRVVVESNQMVVYVDDVSVGTASGSTTYAAAGVSVYVGTPWKPAAKVTLSDITLSEPGLADVCRENTFDTSTISGRMVLGLSAETGWCVDSVTFHFADCGRTTKVGMTGGTPVDRVDIDPTAEYISGLVQYEGCPDYMGGGIEFILKSIATGATTRTISFAGSSKTASVQAEFNVEWPCRIVGFETSPGDADTTTGETVRNALIDCGDGAGGADLSCEDDDDSDDNSLVVILCVVVIVGALIAGIFIFAMMKRRQKPAEPPSAPPMHEPTAPQQPALASIKGQALEMMELASPPPQMAEAIQLPPGHVSGAQAAAMARRVTVVRTETMTGRETFGEVVAVEPAPPPQAELEPEC